MSETQLGRLEKVDLRNIWENEAMDFTPWLAEEENLQLLSETIGITLDLDSVEKNVGTFYADILCKDEEDHWIVIENQLDRTDHKHLGQIFTYGAGLKASVIIWIAASFTDEHIAALDWLNEMTDDRISFFGVEVEAWKIGNSMAAPKFNIVSQPNEWTREINANSSAKTLTEAGELRLKYWGKFKNYMIEHESLIKPKTPTHRNHMNFRIGKAGIFMSAIASYYDSEGRSYENEELRVDLAFSSDRAKAIFLALEQKANEIEKDYGSELIWYKPEEGRYRIQIARKVVLRDESDWPNQHQWLMENLEQMDKVFRDRIQAL